MNSVKDVLASQLRYLMCYGRPSEEDHSLNDINIDLILAMNNCYGHVFVGSFNGDISLVMYDGQKIYTSAYDFCVPDYDEQLDALLHQWKTASKRCHLEAIYERIRTLNGHLLLWV